MADWPQLRLEIADLSITLSGRLDGPELCLTPALRPFSVAGGESDLRVAVRYGTPDLDRAIPVFDSGYVWRLLELDSTWVFSLSSPVVCDGPYTVAVVDRAFRQCEVAIAPGSRAEPVYPLEYPLDELLVIGLLARSQGVQLHACGAVDEDGRGYMFPGQSGAGKTTIALLWARRNGCKLLSDDRIVLRQRRVQVWMYGTPWHGEAGFALPDGAPLSAVMILEHGENNAVTALRVAVATAELVARSFPPFYDPEGVASTLQVLDGTVDSVPCFRLRFMPDSRVIEFVRQEVQRAGC